MFLATTAWRAEHWPGTAEQIEKSGLVLFHLSPTEVEIHKDELFGNAGKIMDKVDAHLLVGQFLNDPRSQRYS
jgi:hypothetical protein